MDLDWCDVGVRKFLLGLRKTTRLVMRKTIDIVDLNTVDGFISYNHYFSRREYEGNWKTKIVVFLRRKMVLTSTAAAWRSSPGGNYHEMDPDIVKG